MAVTFNLYRNTDNTLNGSYPLGDKPVSLPTADLVVDSFESGTMTPDTNTTSFAWGALNRTSIVTGGAGANEVVYPSPIIVHDSRDWTAYQGDNSIRFRYPAEPAQIGTGETLAEQRWSMPLENGRSDFWVRYWIRVPTNYVNDLSNANSKFLAIWANDYGSIGTGAVWNMRPKSDTGSRLLVSYAQGGQTPSAGPSGEIGIGDVFNVPADRGVWFQFVMNFKCASSNGANDGEIRTYYRREGDSSFTELTPLTGLNTYLDGGLSGIRGGYILGSHRGYAADTEWLVDNFEIGSGSLV